jgi:uncharacterized protein (DUF983 family)
MANQTHGNIGVLPMDVKITRTRRCRQCKRSSTFQGWLADKRVWLCTACGKEKA